MKLVTVSEMQSIEREADAAGLTYDRMMENAGRGLAETVIDVYGHLVEKSVIGLVGSGNNGGDTLVALAHLAEQGWAASAYIVRPRPSDDALIKRLERAKGEIFLLADDIEYKRLWDLLNEHSIVLDGVLGTGVRLPLKSKVAEVLDFARRTIAELGDSHVVAVDCPSGVDCDSGEAAAQALCAELTVTMAAVKTGMLKLPAFGLVGDIKVVGIGLAEAGLSSEAYSESWGALKREVPDAEWVRQRMCERPLDSHKGTFGTAMVVAGSVNYTGAALLAGKAAYRSGAGLVTLAVPHPIHGVLAGHFPEATWVLLPHELGVISEDAADVLLDSLERSTALLIGPGFGLEDTTRDFVSTLIDGTPKSGRGGIGFAQTSRRDIARQQVELPPLVIDADGLKLLEQIPEWASLLPALSVLTPHPGEMAVLTGLSKDEIQADRLGIAERYALEWGHVVVLKGAFTIVAAPDHRTAVIPVATPALARAGTGDILAGLVAGLLAQGVEAYDAAVAGAWIHAQAGLHAADVAGNTASVLAGDVLAGVKTVMRMLSQKL